MTNCRIQCALLLIGVLTGGRIHGQVPERLVLRNAGLEEYRAGHFERAEILLRKALEAALQNGNDYDTALTEAYLGDVYQNEDRFTEAEQLYSKALSIFRRTPNTSYDQALVMRSLASVYSLISRDSEAVRVLEEAAKLIKRDTRKEEALAVQLLNSLAIVYFRQGKTGKAETLLLRAISLADETDPTFGYAQILNNLGRVYQRRRKLHKAGDALKRSLEITERQLGSSNPELALTLNNLAGVYTEMRRFGEAEELYQRSIIIFKQTNPPLDAKIVRTLHSLSMTYLRRGDTGRAESVLAQAVELARRNPLCRGDMPTILEAYADVLKSRGQSNMAQSLRLEARRIRMENGGTIRVPSQ